LLAIKGRISLSIQIPSKPSARGPGMASLEHENNNIKLSEIDILFISEV
jgi:hypothetical protein